MSTPRTSTDDQGFSLVEVLVSLGLLAIITIAMLTLIDGSARVSKAQHDIADMTENLRFTAAEIVRMIRMGGTGGVPLLAPGAGGGMNVLAVNTIDNVTRDSELFGSPPRAALAGTDVMVLRGVIGGELYDINGQVALQTTGSTSYRVTIPAASPFTGTPQQLLEPAAGTPIIFTTVWELPVTLASGQTRYFSKYNIGIVTSSSLDGSDPDAPLILDFKTTADGQTETEILSLNEEGTFQPFQEDFVINVGFLDNLVFFISENDLEEPALFMFTPADVEAVELVPNIANLQVALGCDINPADGLLTEVGGAADDDEWFHNAGGDRVPTALEIAALQEVRISVVARSEKAVQDWNQAFQTPENGAVVSGADSRHRHRSVTVSVTLRSHPPLNAG